MCQRSQRLYGHNAHVSTTMQTQCPFINDYADTMPMYQRHNASVSTTTRTQCPRINDYSDTIMPTHQRLCGHNARLSTTTQTQCPRINDYPDIPYTFNANILEKTKHFTKIVSACSYGAQVEFFFIYKCRKSRDTVPLNNLFVV